MSQGLALQCDLSTLEGQSWKHAAISGFTGTAACWAHLTQFTAVEKEGQRFARIHCSYFDDFAVFQQLFQLL